MGINHLAPKKFWVRPRARARAESSIEGACDRYAKERGWESRKMNGLGFNHWPDRLFLPPRKGRSLAAGARRTQFWVEFKRPGKVSTPAQRDMQRELRERGQIVFADVDSREKFIECLERVVSGFVAV